MIISPTVMALKDLHFEGNITPMEWYNHIRHDNGKPDLAAITILSDLVYWHRPTQVRDERTGQVIGYRQKFKRDLLQKSYQHYADLFGLSKRQVTDAFVRLEQQGLIKRVFRQLQTPMGPLPNILFVELNADKVREISQFSPRLSEESEQADSGDEYLSEGETFTSLGGVSLLNVGYPSVTDEHLSQSETSPFSPGGVSRSNVGYPPFKRGTITETTPKTTTETLSERARVVDQMLEIWNQTFAASVPVQRNAFRETKLSMILFSHFNNDLNQWQQFCERVRASSFLQGKGPRGWRATLDWCVEEVNLFKILEGNYQDADSGQTSSPSLDHSLSQAQAHVERMSDPKHQALAQKLSLQLGPNTYNSWFQDMQLQHQAEGRVVLSFSTRFKCDYVKTNYLNVLESLVKELFPDHAKLDLVVGKESADPQIRQGPLQRNAEATPALQKPMLSMVKELTRQLTQSGSRALDSEGHPLDVSNTGALSCDLDSERTPS